MATSALQAAGRGRTHRAVITAVLLLGVGTGCASVPGSSEYLAGQAGPAPPTFSATTDAAAPAAPATPAPAPAAAAPSAAAAAPAAQPGSVVITIDNFAFSSGEVSVPAGATVMVDNRDGANHTLTATDRSFDTGNIPGRSMGTFTAPSKPGTYPYLCTIHPFMTGTLTVT